jgi:hypothetical protein
VGILASADMCVASGAMSAANTTFAYRVSHPVAPVPSPVLARIANGDPREFEDEGGTPPKAYILPVAQPTVPRLTRTAMCHAVASAARANDLPVPFFANLIWQESTFNPRSVSPAGAQGVAQFMPGTAKEYGLNNPFEPIQALHAAGRFLGRLLAQFGNLGLAAAAYNAGPGRVSDFMTKRRKLPDETKNYVVRITGRSADQWTSRAFAHAPEAKVMPAKAPCIEAVEEAAAQARAVHEAKLAASAARGNTTKLARRGRLHRRTAKAVRSAAAHIKREARNTDLTAAKRSARRIGKLASRVASGKNGHRHRSHRASHTAKARTTRRGTHFASAR